MEADSLRCPVCNEEFPLDDIVALAAHLVAQANASDDHHVMWLNRYVTKHRVGQADLAELLQGVLTNGTPPSSTSRVER
jgi:hypothetical protein